MESRYKERMQSFGKDVLLHITVPPKYFGEVSFSIYVRIFSADNLDTKLIEKVILALTWL